jgi:hypothetical protein
VADRTPRPRPRRAAHLSAVSVNRFGFPHAAQVIRVARKTRDLRTNRWRAVTVDAVTSLGSAQARPARLADLLRGHWAIEALHHVRDVTFAEDACKVPPAPPRMSWRPCATWPSACCARAGPVNLAAAPATHTDPCHPGEQLG